MRPTSRRIPLLRLVPATASKVTVPRPSAAASWGCAGPTEIAAGEAGAPPRHEPRAGSSSAALAAIKTAHTLAWFSVESCMLYVLSAGFAKRSDRRVAMAAGVVAGESLIFVANGFRCPLTQLAERLGAERGSVTDIYLPRWLAHNLPAIHPPLLVLAAFLHGRNLRRQRRQGPEVGMSR